MLESTPAPNVTAVPSYFTPNIKTMEAYYRVKGELEKAATSEAPSRIALQQFVDVIRKKRVCLLCGHYVHNSTQMLDHIRGEHFNWYGYVCRQFGW